MHAYIELPGREFLTSELLLKNLDVNKDIYICFIDYEKEFDQVNHEKMVQILNETKIEKQIIMVTLLSTYIGLKRLL